MWSRSAFFTAWNTETVANSLQNVRRKERAVIGWNTSTSTNLPLKATHAVGLSIKSSAVDLRREKAKPHLRVTKTQQWGDCLDKQQQGNTNWCAGKRAFKNWKQIHTTGRFLEYKGEPHTEGHKTLKVMAAL